MNHAIENPPPRPTDDVFTYPKPSDVTAEKWQTIKAEALAFTDALVANIQEARS